MHQEREKGKRIAWLWAQNCAFIHASSWKREKTMVLLVLPDCAVGFCMVWLLVQDSPLIIICCWAHFLFSEVSVCTHLFSSDASNYGLGFCGFHQFLQENAEVVTSYKKTSSFYTQWNSVILIMLSCETCVICVAENVVLSNHRIII